MSQLLVTLRTESQDRDLSIDFDDRATLSQLVEELCESLGVSNPEWRTIERTSRGSVDLDPSERISRQDLRSGDIIRLAQDSGVRSQQDHSTMGTLVIANGPDAGIRFEIARGETTIGRADKCDITLSDTMASRQHAKLIVSDIVEIADLGSTNGVIVNESQISQSRRLASGDVILIGDTELVLDTSAASPSELSEATNTVDFNRPPRVGNPYPGIVIELPAPPNSPSRQRIPKVSALVPLLMGAGLYFITKNIASVAFMAMSPVLIVGSWWENKRSGRAEHQQLTIEFEEDLATCIATLDDEREKEVAARMEASPAVSELPAHIEQLSRRLWERQPEDEDFLEIRVGLAVQDSRSTVKLTKGGARDRQAELAEVPPRYAQLPPVPVTVSLPEVGTLGVAGAPEFSTGMAQSVVIQAAALQSPAELVICALLTEEALDNWDWLKWLPHVRATKSPIKGPHLATSIDLHLGLINELSALISERTSDSPSSSTRTIFEPQVLLIVDDEIALERARLMPLLDHGPGSGISIVWVSSTVRRLPKACGAVIDISPSGGDARIGFVERQLTIDSSTCEIVRPSMATRIARSLSPIVDVSSGQAADSEIPRTAPLVELLGGTSIMDDHQLIRDRWDQSFTGHSLRGPVGAGAAGVFSLDLRHDGPHGLVAGTTGAGKSEFLQGMLVGLAATHSPARVTFLLVDYKGGSAFKDCVKLPHTVGLVTDLTPALVKRALTSLRAELHRREMLLNEANAKDLMQMEEENHPKTPPSLIIVVDEFAALAREVPEFVDGVVDVAQRGRSLGLHLMLATQRPQGVVTDNIRANTNLKIALRVASSDESIDVIGSPAAGNLDRSIPGRALARLGPSELIPFQSGYVGGRTTAADDAATILIGDFNSERVDIWKSEENGDRGKPSGDTDLERMVESINSAFRNAEIEPPRRPWLDPLSEAYDLSRLPRSGSDSALTMGVIDDPSRQTQRVITFDPDRDGSILVYGASGSGKTVVLRTLAASAALSSEQTPVHVYGLDFAGRGLDMIDPLPHVGSVISGDDYERVTRLLNMIREQIDDRSNRFAKHRASSLTEYRRNSRNPSEPRLLILLDGFENFAAAYERIDRGEWHELLPRLVADGRAVGINFVLTGGRRTAFPMALTSGVPAKIVLRLANPDEYMTIGVDGSLLDGSEPAGRGIFDDGVMQVGILGSDRSTQGQSEAFRSLAAALQGSPPAPPIQMLPDKIDLSALQPVGGPTLTIGMTDKLEPFALPLGDKILITGPTRSGKTTAIQRLAQAAVREGITPIVFSGRRRVEGLPEGVDCIVGASAIAEYISGSQPKPGDLLLVDEFEELFEGEADFPLQTAFETDGVSVFAACEVSLARRGFSPLLGLMKRSRRTLVLLPDTDLDGDLAHCPLPRNNRAFPPGRGYWSDAGRIELVQVAVF